MNDSRPQKPPEEDEGDPSGSGSGVCTLGTEESEMAVREEDVGKGLGERVLKWAAEAEGGMLGAVLVAGSAVLYVIAGRLGILIIGVVGGMLLAKSLEGGSGKEKLLGSEDLMRLLRGESRMDITKSSRTLETPDLSILPPETRKALEELVDCLVKDYIDYWYTSLVPRPSGFPSLVRTGILRFALRVHSHLSGKRAADLLLIFIITIANTLVVFFRELSLALESGGYDGYSPEAIQSYLEDYPQSALGQLLDRGEQGHRIYQCAETLLTTFLDKEILDCEPVRTFLTEITAGVVLEKVVDKVSRPEFLAEWAVYLLDDETKPKFLAKLDLGEAEGDLENVAEKLQEKVGGEDGMERAVREAEEMRKLLVEAERATIPETIPEVPPPALPERPGPELPARPVNGTPGRASPEQRRSPPRPMNGTPPLRSTPPPRSRHKLDLSIDGVEQRRLNNFGRHYSGEMHPDGAEQEPIPRQSTSSSRPSTSSQRPVATSFDQMNLPPPPPSATTAQRRTLHTATATLSSLSETPTRPLRTKPTAPYFLTIEPNIPNSTGWMLSRKYPDFESLHEVLKRIASVSSARNFIERYPSLPAFKGISHEDLGRQLEAYLNTALSERDLAESSALERFFEKNEENMGLSNQRSIINPFAAIGKGLAQAPLGFKRVGQNVGEGLFSAVNSAQGAVERTGGVLGNVFNQRRGSGFLNGGSGNNSQGDSGTTTPNTAAWARGSSTAYAPYQSTLDRTSSSSLNTSTAYHPPSSTDSLTSTTIPTSHSDPSLTRDPRYLEADKLAEKSLLDKYIQLELPSSPSRPLQNGQEKDVLNLPPPPSDMPDDFDLSHTVPPPPLPRRNTESTPPPPPAPVPQALIEEGEPMLSSQETLLLIDIIFTLLTELYTLSPSTSPLRRRLLSLSKSVLLRPGTRTLETISTQLSTLLSSQTSDEAIAKLLVKVRKALSPTAAELARWEKSKAGREARREGEAERARVLVGGRLVPRGIRGVMGERASREAAEVLWDAVVGSSIGRAVVVSGVVEGGRGVCQ